MTTVRELITKWVFKSDTDKVKRFESTLRSVKRAASLAAGGLGILTAGASAAGYGIYRLTTGVADSLDKIGKLSKRTGISTELLQQFKHAADLSDVNIETLPLGLKTLAQQAIMAAKGSKDSIDSFRKLGVSVKDAGGNFKSTTDLLRETLGAMADMEEGPERTEVAMRLLGRAGIEVMPMLEGGRFALAEMMGEAKKLGLVVGGKGVAAAEEFNDEMTRLKSTIKGVVFGFASELFPVFKDAISSMKEWVAANREFISQRLHEIALKIGRAFKDLFTVIKEKDLFGKLTVALEGVVNAMAWVIRHGTAIKWLFITLIGMSIASKLAPVAGVLGKVAGGLFSMAKGGPGAIGALNGVLGKLGLIGAAAGVGWTVGTMIDKWTGASERWSDALVGPLKKMSEIKRLMAGKLELQAGLKDQVKMYADMIKSGRTSVGIEGGKRMKLTRENIVGRLSAQAGRLGISKGEQEKMMPEIVRQLNLALAQAPSRVTTNTISPQINVSVQPGTPERIAKQVADKTGASMANTFRRAMGDAR